VVKEDFGIVLNQRTISFIIGLITLFSLLFVGVSAWNDYTYRIDSLEQRNISLLNEITALNQRLVQLSDSIVELTITLNRVDDRTRGKNSE